MYYDDSTTLNGLGIGVKVKVKVPKDITNAAKELPALNTNFSRFTSTIEGVQVYLPWAIIGAAAVVAFIVLTRSSDSADKEKTKK